MNLLLDCDGVLANFIDAAIKFHGREDTFKHDDVTRWNWYEDWEMTEADFWRPLKGAAFWLGIEPYPWAHELVKQLLAEFGEVTVLTAPNEDPEFFSARAHWVKDQFGLTTEDVCVCTRKWLLANPHNLLVDDNPRNTTNFIADGGTAILFPQNYNESVHSSWQEVVEEAKYINRIKV